MRATPGDFAVAAGVRPATSSSGDFDPQSIAHAGRTQGGGPGGPTRRDAPGSR